MATVNGHKISRDQFARLLSAGRGVSLLEELIVLDLVSREARAKGLSVSAGDVESEYDRSLRALMSPLPSADPASLDRETGEQLLDEILASRGVSRPEYRLGMLRNAYLRELAGAGVRITVQQLREEYQRAYGARVRVRHIQLAGGSELDDVRRQLEAGADFAELARRYSANRVTAPGGGLLAPFSRKDPDLPALLREAAFGLSERQMSNPIRIDNWYHIIKVEERLAPGEVPLEQVRDELEARLRERIIPPEMQRISAELFGRARVKVADPSLAAEFFKRHPELRRSGQ